MLGSLDDYIYAKITKISIILWIDMGDKRIPQSD